MNHPPFKPAGAQGPAAMWTIVRNDVESPLHIKDRQAYAPQLYGPSRTRSQARH